MAESESSALDEIRRIAAGIDLSGLAFPLVVEPNCGVDVYQTRGSGIDDFTGGEGHNAARFLNAENIVVNESRYAEVIAKAMNALKSIQEVLERRKDGK